MITFMSTKDRCLQCGEKLTGVNRISIKTEEGTQNFCNAYCMNKWQGDYDDFGLIKDTDGQWIINPTLLF